MAIRPSVVAPTAASRYVPLLHGGCAGGCNQLMATVQGRGSNSGAALPPQPKPASQPNPAHTAHTSNQAPSVNARELHGVGGDAGVTTGALQQGLAAGGTDKGRHVVHAVRQAQEVL